MKSASDYKCERTVRNLTIGESSTSGNEARVKEIAVCDHNNQIHSETPNNHSRLRQEENIMLNATGLLVMKTQALGQT